MASTSARFRAVRGRPGTALLALVMVLGLGGAHPGPAAADPADPPGTYQNP